MASCRNCFDNCDEPISDKCIRYTGEDIDLLKIEKGDQLSLVNAITLAKLLSALDGTGITPKDVSIENYDVLKDLLKYKDPTLNNILQILIDNQGDINERLSAIGGEVAYTFDTKQLTLPASPTKDDIIQALINQSNNTFAAVSTLATTYVKLSDLTTLVNQVLAGSEGEETAVASQQYLKMVPSVAYEYFGSLSNFDNTGKGLASVGFDKVYLCNGLNGTPDKRGRVGVGAIKNIPGGTLDSAVDPSIPANAAYNYALGDKVGKATHKLTVTELPEHSHTVIDPGHQHNLSTHKNDSGISNQPNGVYDGNDNDATPLTLVTNKAFTGISVGATGGNQPHNNVQPSIAALYIMHIL